MLVIRESLRDLTNDESVKCPKSVESQTSATDSNAGKNEVQSLEINKGTYNYVDEYCEDNKLVIKKSLPDTNCIQEFA